MGTVTNLDEIRRARQGARRIRMQGGSNRDARARRYRLRAEELRAISEEVMLRETCLTLLSLAQSYDQMAAAIANMACEEA